MARKQWGCTGKVRHKNRKGARYAAKVAAQERGAVLSVYKCQFCGFWHTGNLYRVNWYTLRKAR